MVLSARRAALFSRAVRLGMGTPLGEWMTMAELASPVEIAVHAIAAAPLRSSSSRYENVSAEEVFVALSLGTS